MAMESSSSHALADSDKNWDQMEDIWWSQVAAIRHTEDQHIIEEHEELAKSVQRELVDLWSERTRVATQLQMIRDAVDRKEAQLKALDGNLRSKQHEKEVERSYVDAQKREYFRHARERAANDRAAHGRSRVSMPEPQPTSNGDSSYELRYPHRPRHENAARDLPPHATDPRGPDQHELQQPTAVQEDTMHGIEQLPGSLMAAGDHQGDLTGAEIVDAQGDYIGPVRKLGRTNHWIAKCLELPVRQPVMIRPSRKFDASSLAAIYEAGDAKAAKWLGVMIQATGQVQSKPCTTCVKGIGVFSQCIIIGGDELPRCGNCEWNRQACVGAALEPSAHTNSPVHSPETRPKSRQQTATGPAGGFTAVNTPTTGTTHPFEASPATLTGNHLPLAMTPSDAATGSDGPIRAPPRRSLPSGKGAGKRSKQHPSTPAQHGAEDSLRVDTEIRSSRASDDGSEHREQSEQQDDGNGELLPEITQEGIVLKHDGKVYTEPELMRGVPVEKITPDHPYWEPSWKDIEEAIRPRFETWQEKYESKKDSSEKSDKHAKFLAGRQKNRGASVLKYLESGAIHPYQIVGKQWINNSLISYDTIYRLVGTIEELEKFDININALDWIRQRLHEIYTENPEKFKLDKIVHNLYGDPKLSALRSKNGFGNIGRPAGIKMTKHASGDENESDAKPRKIAKRKSHGGARATPQKRMSSVHQLNQSIESADVEKMPDAGRTPEGSQRVKKLKTEHEQQAATPSTPQLAAGTLQPPTIDRPTPEDLEYDGYTTSDSCSHDKLMKVDFRLGTVKTPRFTSNDEVTQYWHWLSINNEPMLEHQVLRELNPPSWGVYKEPHDFHVRLRELTHITFAKDSLIVVVGTKEVDGVEYRGDVLAQFRRERTKRRFLRFMMSRGAQIVKTTSDVCQQAWDNLKSEVLPNEDED